MKSKIYMDNRMIDSSNPYKVIKDVLKDGNDKVIKHTMYVDVPATYDILFLARFKDDWSMSVQGVSNLFFMYSEDQDKNEIMSIIFGQDTDKVCYVANRPIYITLDKEHRSIIISLIQFPSPLIEYTVIFDEMDIVIEETEE